MKITFTALRLFILLSIITGVLYPLAVTGIARLAFPVKAGGSLVYRDGKCVGSALLAQETTDARYFWPRPSATDYGTVPSGASNLGLTNTKLYTQVEERAAHLRTAHALATDAPVPADLLFASGSGLDPHISPAAARFQVGRVSRARGFDATQQDALSTLVEKSIEPGAILGEDRVNVFLLNLQLDGIK